MARTLDLTGAAGVSSTTEILSLEALLLFLF